MKVRFVKLRDDAVTPLYQTTGAAGMDLHACIDEPVEVPPGDHREIPFGIAVEIPEGWQVELRGRSGLAFRHKLSMTHGVGTIDSDYRGELMACLYNHGSRPYVVYPGDRIAQAVFMPAPQVELVEVDELSATTRGEGGVGSTGV